MKLLLLFALPREVAETVRVMGRKKKIDGLPFRGFSVNHQSHVLTIVETGMGVENSARVLLRMIQAGKPDTVISIGYCGALSSDASVGDVVWASRILLVDGQNSESLSLPDSLAVLEKLASRLRIREGTFITMKDWMKKQELIRFASPEMTLPVCDMETFALARLCNYHRLPFFAIRAVSDGADRDLPFDPWSVCDKKGNYRVLRALRLFLTRPRLLTHGMELLRNSKIASHNLSEAVSALLQVL
jgi:nucleoside phosphorylase